MLDARAEAESNTEVSGWMETAKQVLEGGDLRKFGPFASEVIGDRRPGDGLRQFSRKDDQWADRLRGRRGGEEEGDGEEKKGDDEKKGDAPRRGRGRG